MQDDEQNVPSYSQRPEDLRKCFCEFHDLCKILESKSRESFTESSELLATSAWHAFSARPGLRQLKMRTASILRSLLLRLHRHHGPIPSSKTYGSTSHRSPYRQLVLSLWQHRSRDLRRASLCSGAVIFIRSSQRHQLVHRERQGTWSKHPSLTSTLASAHPTP